MQYKIIESTHVPSVVGGTLDIETLRYLQDTC